MAASAPPFDIGSFIEADPDWHDGWPYIKGTHVTVARVAILHQQGESAEQIARAMDLSLAQVHAALAYYLANADTIEADIDAYEAKARAIEQRFTAGVHDR